MKLGHIFFRIMTFTITIYRPQMATFDEITAYIDAASNLESMVFLAAHGEILKC
jgi:hypothetical protein